MKPATLQAMKDGELGFDDITKDGGPSGSLRARDGLGLADQKNGGCGKDAKGRNCGSQVVMMPGDVQIAVTYSSGNNLASKNNWALLDAWQNGLR